MNSSAGAALKIPESMVTQKKSRVNPVFFVINYRILSGKRVYGNERQGLL